MSALIDKYTRIPGDPGGATVTWESIHRAIFRRRCTGPDSSYLHFPMAMHIPETMATGVSSSSSRMQANLYARL